MKTRVWTVSCPSCKAPVGASCKYPNGTERPSHSSRITAYLRDEEKKVMESDSRKPDGNAHQTVNTG